MHTDGKRIDPLEKQKENPYSFSYLTLIFEVIFIFSIRRGKVVFVCLNGRSVI